MNYTTIVLLYEALEATSKRLEKTIALARFLKTVPAEDAEAASLLIQGKVFPIHDERKIGIASKIVMKALARATGLSTAVIENAWKKTGDLGTSAQQFLAAGRQATLQQQTLTLQKVFKTLQLLATLEGKGSVDKKILLLTELLAAAQPNEGKYLVRTVLEQMRVGIGEGTIRDALVFAYFSQDIGLIIPDSSTSTSEQAEGEHAEKEQDKLMSTNDKITQEKNTNEKKNTKKKKKKATAQGIVIENREAYKSISEIIQTAYDMTADFGLVMRTLLDEGLEGLKSLKLKTGRPVKVMLYQRATSISNAFEIVGKPAAVEYKYDGFRMLVHKKGNQISLFTRRLEDVTAQFPDVVCALLEHINEQTCILDCEAVGYTPSSTRYRPFQEISQRIKRKHDIEQIAKEIPVEVVVFDILLKGDRNTTEEPYRVRRALVEEIVKNPQPGVLRLAEHIETSDEKQADEFYRKALATGNEGVMFKNPESIYKPGSRVGFGVKVKPTLETLQLVIVGAEWGTGKRAQVLSSVLLACKETKNSERADESNISGSPDTHVSFVEIGKVSTGLKEKSEEGFSFEQLTALLKPLIIKEEGRLVRITPKIIIEVDYEEIQASPSYTSGFALRFPRFVGYREDLGPEDANTLEDVRRFYQQQRGRDA